MTIQTYAILEGENVTNLILWDDEADEYNVPEGLTIRLATDEVSIGWKHVDGSWVAPPVPEPEPMPTEDPAVTEAKVTGMNQLMALGITEPVARMIVGLPPK
jgi:hypothetical protein